MNRVNKFRLLYIVLWLFQFAVYASMPDANLSAFIQTKYCIGKRVRQAQKELIGTPIFQSDIPLTINREGRFFLAEDIVVNAAVLKASVYGPIGIGINAPNVDLDLNNHTIFITGVNVNGIVTLADALHTRIHNGTIRGTGKTTDFGNHGIIAATDDITISNIQFIAIAGGPGTYFQSAGVLITGLFIPTITYSTAATDPLHGVTVENCSFTDNYTGVSIYNFGSDITIRDCNFDGNLLAITEPERGDYSYNVLIDNCGISNCGLHGIYITYNQANWTIKKTNITNSFLDGMILVGFQNLKVSDCQIFNSGSYGIIAAIRQSQNVEITDCKIFNSQNSALRIDNIGNLIVEGCQLTNYAATTLPIMKVQDVFNGVIRNCQLNSTAGTSDGLFVRTCQGISVDNCNVNIFCNQPRTSCPVGINFHGSVQSGTIRNCIVSGNPSAGIAIVQDTPNNTNGGNSGITVQNCTVQGAVSQGILLSNTSSSSILASQVFDGSGDGIVIDSATLNCSIRDNTVTNNAGIGINNMGTNSSIFHNFAKSNGTNYAGVSLVVAPAPGVGVLENISG